ncbi:Phosphatidylinositol-5-phosphate 4-kinase type-2 alpha [Fasciola gigantica]|uniref:1-phosphatidylinositol-5-phosphate 4-kinase n=1 Tax=Fasciola gigantica TaxID=46835 RepID=A0A504YV25_FASGI|nr:Phosphatidylinositol-5-phosphate 4-kinase type-2 alpha [Fasciola gigantica]
MATISKQKKMRKVRQKLKLFRANEPLKSVLMWGINYSFSAMNHVKPRAMLLKDDFKAYMKVKINNYLFNKENMPSRFKFKEYCPMVFKALRDRFSVNKLDYWDAFTRHQPLWDSARGKSGSKFLVTYNRQFVAKTISSEEVEQMHQMLEEYYAYIVNCHGQTLLPQYLGLYRLTVNDQETYILVMRNVFSPRLAVHKKYDLKVSPSHKPGKNASVRRQHFPDSDISHPNLSNLIVSTAGLTKHHNSAHRRTCSNDFSIDREANEKEKSKPLPTLKDNDFLNDVCKIYIGPEAKTRVMSLMESDVQFLQDNNLMDYSILIGIHELGTVSENSVPLDDTSNDLPGGPGSGTEDRVASAGDGLGTIVSLWHSRRLSVGRPSVVEPSILAAGGNLSAGDDDEDDDLLFLPDTGAAPVGASGNLTPPDSPTNGPAAEQIYCGELHPSLEYYAIKSSPESPRQLIYFVAIIDILTRYGMRKRTAQTYKTVKHGAGADISTVKPELYGRRLLDFIAQCIE